MIWKKITDINGALLTVYDASNKTESAKDWPRTQCAPKAIHSEIPAPPDGDYVFNNDTDTWVLNIALLKAQKRSQLKKRAWEELLTDSPQGAKLTNAENSIRSAKTQSDLDKITL